MRKKTMHQCEVCGSDFQTTPSVIRQGRRFCSRICQVRPMSDRFNEKVDANGPVPSHRPELGNCHIWTSAKNPSGYGLFAASGTAKKCQMAHRVAWFISTGEWPSQFLLHACDNRACVRISHLFEGTQKENIADMIRKGRRRAGFLLGEAVHNSRLSGHQVLEIRASVANGESRRAVARRLGVDRCTVADVVAGRTWKHVV